MIKRSSKYYLLRGIVVAIVALVCLLSYAVTTSTKVASKVKEDNLTYVSYEILTDNTVPVTKQEETSSIMRPYVSKSVEIGKDFYDSKAEAENQEKSIIYYENTYIQNQGVDYTSKDEFDVNSIAEGKVISITKDDIVGTTIKIEHDNDLISVYQSVKDVEVKEKDTVAKGQIIAKSGTNSISSDLGNHLHFELYNKNVLVNPEQFFIDQGN